MNKLRVILIGVFAKILDAIIPIKKKYWVFGADYGHSYREGSKYLIEYMYKYHQDYECIFITRSKKVITEVRTKGIKCYNNYSLKGIIAICKAENIFTTQYLSDISYIFKKKGRSFHYILHGMPYKLAADALPNYVLPKRSLKNKINTLIASYFIKNCKIQDVSFLSVTSDFLVQFEMKDHSGKIPVKVLGMPRNDALFDHERMLHERWIDDLNGKFVITYMPTHRKYGEGELSPNLFIENQEYQHWLREHNAVVLIKQHPNMIPKLKDVKQNDVIRDITAMGLDPQVCIYHSDVLITDYSSVWMDYLLLRRPLLFYYYDDFEGEDAGTHYSIKDIKPGHFCYSESELFNTIKKCITNYEEMKPSGKVVSMFHKYVDGNSCERYYNEIIKEETRS